LSLPKEYIASIRFGIETDSMDLDGKIIRSKKVTDLDIDLLNNILMDFTGNIRQMPPMYSALKHKGKPLYKFARMGIDIERDLREIEIMEIEVLKIQEDISTLRVRCSSGTYIRSLASDIGKAYGTGAVLAGLIRTGIGDFTVSQAKGVDSILDIAGNDMMPENSGWIISLQELFRENPSVYINKDSERKILNGSSLSADMINIGRKGLPDIQKELKNFKGRFKEVISVKAERDSMLALHEMKKGFLPGNVKSFNKDFTKSVVIF
jgi:tRNA pseudouridine55 synthase